jgi:hypothetical protein
MQNVVSWNAVVPPNHFARARVKNTLSLYLAGISAWFVFLEICTGGAMSAFWGTAGKAGDRAASRFFDPELSFGHEKS